MTARHLPAGGPTTALEIEYLMTLFAPVDPPKPIDPTLVIYHVRPGGWVAGPKIKGTLVAPPRTGCASCRAVYPGSTRAG
jgi:hypothetical protein